LRKSLFEVFIQMACRENLSKKEGTLPQYQGRSVRKNRDKAVHHICMVNHYLMILVFTTTILFFGIFFWNAERLNRTAERRDFKETVAVQRHETISQAL
jgi:hypothetical protein